MNALFRASGSRTWSWLAATLVAAVGLVGGPDRVWAQGKKPPKAEKILEKSIQGRGGRAAFEKLHTCVSKGTIEIAVGEQNIRGTIARYEAAPNKVYTVIDLGPSGKIESGTDGEIHWERRSPGGSSVAEGDEKVIRARRSTFHGLLRWREHYEKVECVGKETVDDRSCYKVVMTPAVGAPITIYYDRKTGFPIKSDTVTKSAAGEFPVQTRIDDYRQIAGVSMPHKTTRQVALMGRTQTVTTVWESIEYNADIPAERFKVPYAVRKLAEKPSKEESSEDEPSEDEQ